MIALLGRQDHPTDGVADYCQLLRQALAARGYEPDVFRVAWETEGWLKSLMRLWRELRRQSPGWVLVQYTALAWSRRGFPLLLVAVLWVLRLRKARIAVVFHDSSAYEGRRFVDRARRFCQLWVMSFAYRRAQKAIFPVPLDRVPWLPANRTNAVFIPVGAIIPESLVGLASANAKKSRTIAVFGITGDGNAGNELSDISFVVRAAAERMPGICLKTMGRGSGESEAGFRQALAGCPVEYSPLGLLTAEDVARALCDSGVSLFVRGGISTHRTTAIASIACGIPLVAYCRCPMPVELSEAGVVGIRVGDREALAEATIQVLNDDNLWQELHQRNRRAFEKTFSWEAIASRFIQVLADA